MSAYVLDKESIDVLTKAVDVAITSHNLYPGSYHLSDKTAAMLSKYEGDLHNIYRLLFITNIKAVNGRYGENTKTLPKYTKLYRSTDEDTTLIKKACGIFGCYMYQCSEDPIYNSDIYNALYDVYNLLCNMLVSKTLSWSGEWEF